MAVNQDGVGERSESGVKAGKENCTVYSFPGVAACGESNCGSQREQMIKVVCFFVVLKIIYTAWLLIKMELVNGRKLFNLSVSCADSSLYQREPVLRLVWVVDL